MNIYDFSVKNINGEEVSLSKYKGKVLLVVNTATQCGLTPQYDAMQELYEKYQAQGFEILDFPCNQFKEQAPESDAEIDAICNLNYGTTFPRFAKIDVNGPDADPMYVWLKNEHEEFKKDIKTKAFLATTKALRKSYEANDITWNFEKFLINGEGHVVKRFAPTTKPNKLEEAIEDLLK